MQPHLFFNGAKTGSIFHLYLAASSCIAGPILGLVSYGKASTLVKTVELTVILLARERPDIIPVMVIVMMKKPWVVRFLGSTSSWLM